jgi:hypothetical protein
MSNKARCFGSKPRVLICWPLNVPRPVRAGGRSSRARAQRGGLEKHARKQQGGEPNGRRGPLQRRGARGGAGSFVASEIPVGKQKRIGLRLDDNDEDDARGRPWHSPQPQKKQRKRQDVNEHECTERTDHAETSASAIMPWANFALLGWANICVWAARQRGSGSTCDGEMHRENELIIVWQALSPPRIASLYERRESYRYDSATGCKDLWAHRLDRLS